jgi:transcriptional regulator of acetoin/glycerol metabolism
MSRTDTQLNRLKTARAQLLDSGTVSEGLLPEPIERSWVRCADTGLSLELTPAIARIEQQALLELQDKNSRLLRQAMPEMESLHSQISGTHSMILLTDAGGTILHALGDSQFVSKAQSVALQPGASWREDVAGTNAIGTALVEEAPVLVNGAEHYFSQNAFLSCSAAPILDPYGQAIGVLDVSGDYRQPQAHTMALVLMSAQMIENRLFSSEFARDITLHFHARPEFVGTLWEGIAVFSPEGRLLAINKSGGAQLGLKSVDIGHMTFADLFDGSLAAMLSASKRLHPHGVPLVTHRGKQFHGKVDPGMLSSFATTNEKPSVSKAVNMATEPDTTMLDILDTGDQQIRVVIDRVKKVLRRDIPILVEGETGTGKELLAKAIHTATGRKGLFVPINCASIPEGLIEAELFGYEDGAFTGARRSGAPGKILQANGGTLFLDEIGEMPLQLQARLLRVLQEREVVPLGSAKGMPVDIAIISATNRKLRDHVDAGVFREDLYYRLNGLRVSLPPLRERSDLDILVASILDEESDAHTELHREVAALFKMHPWRGNVRQLRNVLRAALAFVEGEHVIKVHHLPEDFVEESGRGYAAIPHPENKKSTSILAAEGDLIQHALREHAGNMTLAAKHLGISRATLYRKVQKINRA